MQTCTAPVWTARTLDEALALRAEHPDAVVLAGGTDLMVALEAGGPPPVEVLNLWGCEGLSGVWETEDGGLRLGALTPFAALRDAPVPEALKDCARTIGASQIQARATLGGNIVNASPAGDSLPLWLALDASFELRSRVGRRVVPADTFFLSYRKVDLAPDELLTAILLPSVEYSGDTIVYRKVGTRLAQAISKVVLGGRVRLDGARVAAARLALGSVAPVPARLLNVEGVLVGRELSAASVESALSRLNLDIAPIDDVRSTAAYRARVAANVLRAWLCGLIPR